MRYLMKIPKLFPRAFSNDAKEIKRIPIYASQQPKDENLPVNETLEEFKRKQRHFQQDNGVPIFLKNGASDQALFYLTIGLAGLGLVNVAAYIYHSAFPSKHTEGHMEITEV